MRFTEQRLRSARRWIAWVCFEAVTNLVIPRGRFALLACLLLAGLSNKYHIYALDLRGHGKSEKRTAVIKFFAYPKMFNFLTGLNLSDVAILGHSMGCAVI